MEPNGTKERSMEKYRGKKKNEKKKLTKREKRRRNMK